MQQPGTSCCVHDAGEELFGQAYLDLAGPITREARRITRNDADAEDVCAQVFAQAWAQLHRYDPRRGDLAAWLLCIARSRALDLVRARRRQLVGVERLASESAAEVTPPEADRPDASTAIASALRHLPQPLREITELMYCEGLTQRQIALVTGRPLGTVKTLIRKAMHTLRRQLEAAAPPEASRGGPLSTGLTNDGGPFTTERIDRDDHDAFAASRNRGPRLAPLAGLHVLAVDDDRHTRELLVSLLGRAGATCTVCADAEETLAALRVLWPDVLIADITMPGEDGYSLMARIRSLGAAPLRALAFTACGREDERARALLAGFTAHLNKPVYPAALSAAVARLAGRAA